MVKFFESDSCISKNLAAYFGEHIGKEACGHCSFCTSGKSAIQCTTELPPLTNFPIGEIIDEFKKIAPDMISALNLTKFLCSINTPVFSKLKIKKSPQFGLMEKYPFQDVKKWVSTKL